MPLEIKELHIKAVIDNSKSSGGGGGGTVKPSAADIQTIVAECVHQVLEILKDQKDR